jgi:hypothetical protein
VGSCRTERSDGDAGFATAAATLISLALAVTASAITVLAVGELRGAEADGERAKVEARLDGLHLLAAQMVSTDPKAVRLNWAIPGEGGAAQVLAEAESSKLPLAPEGGIDRRVAAALGVSDPVALGGRLAGLSPEEALGPALEGLDPSPAWRSCARSVFSPYGAASKGQKVVYASPVDSGVIARIGEVWRIRVQAEGWADDRIVRLTGNPAALAAVIARRLYRMRGEGVRCETLSAK